MKRPEQIPMFSKAFLAAALTGFITTIINLIYNFAFRTITRFVPDFEFNITSITVSTMVTWMVIGLLFFLFLRYTNIKVFMVTFFIIVLACIALTFFTHPSNHEFFYGNNGLVTGFIILSGLNSLIILPYLYNHPEVYI